MRKTKTCPRCGIDKLASDFGVNKSRYDGLQNYCKVCRTLEWEIYHTKSQERNSRYYKENKEKIVRRAVVNYRQKYNTNINFKINMNCRKRIKLALKHKKASMPTLELLGCSVEQLRSYLESLFDQNMSWENYGSYWQIDHIRPVSSFDLLKPENQKICFNWKNMQPLEKSENMKKRDHYVG